MIPLCCCSYYYCSCVVRMCFIFHIRRHLNSEAYNLVGLAKSTWLGNASNHLGDPYCNGVLIGK